MNLLDLGYVSAGLLASPFLAVKAVTDRRYRHRLSERFGAAGELNGEGPRIWFHAASVGETVLLKTLVPALRKRKPTLRFAVSTLTITGRENAAKLSPDVPPFYYPFDFSFAVRRALRRVRPDVVVLVELEVWPNFTKVAARQGIPVVVINGRISDRSFGRYRKMGWFFRPSFRRLTAVGAQNDTYGERIRSLGAGDVRENMTTAGLDLRQIQPGNVFFIGSEVTLEVTGDCEPCRRMDELRPGLREALDGRRGILTMVLSGGSLKVGDSVRVEP